MPCNAREDITLYQRTNDAFALQKAGAAHGDDAIYLARREQRAKRDLVALRETLDIRARQGGIAGRSGNDTYRVYLVRHFAVWAFPHVHHHRGNCIAYSAGREQRERALLALVNVLLLLPRPCRQP
jgi:hypothetical protein